MKVVVIEKETIHVVTYENVVSISYDDSTGIVTINNGTNHTFYFDAIKLMII